MTALVPDGARGKPRVAPPKRLVLSRKGFDSGYGGMPSPILPDGRLQPLPIPVDHDDASGAMTWKTCSISWMAAKSGTPQVTATCSFPLRRQLEADRMTGQPGGDSAINNPRAALSLSAGSGRSSVIRTLSGPSMR